MYCDWDNFSDRMCICAWQLCVVIATKRWLRVSPDILGINAQSVSPRGGVNFVQQEIIGFVPFSALCVAALGLDRPQSFFLFVPQKSQSQANLDALFSAATFFVIIVRATTINHLCHHHQHSHRTTRPNSQICLSGHPLIVTDIKFVSSQTQTTIVWITNVCISGVANSNSIKSGCSQDKM